MSDRVLVPLATGQWLALEEAQFREALAAGSAAHTPDAEPQEQLLDDAGLAKLMNVPESWVATAARTGQIPSFRCGRWRRFKPSVVLAVLERNRTIKKVATAGLQAKPSLLNGGLNSER